MEESVQWVKAYNNEIMSHNDDKSFTFGTYNQKTASDDFKNSLSLFNEAKKIIQNDGCNFSALIFTAGDDDHVILGFTYDPKNILAVTSVMYIEVMYTVPMTRLMDDVKAFSLSVYLDTLCGALMNRMRDNWQQEHRCRNWGCNLQCQINSAYSLYRKWGNYHDICR